VAEPMEALSPAVGVTISADDAELYFKAALSRTLIFEGVRLTDDQDDPGGLTKYGISAAAHPNVDIANLTRAGAIAIYRAEYWKRNNLQYINSYTVSAYLFDEAVNPLRGPGWLVQSALCYLGWPVKVDGIIGLKESVPRINFVCTRDYRRDYLMGCMCTLRGMRYMEEIASDVSDEKYKRGWMRRGLPPFQVSQP